MSSRDSRSVFNLFSGKKNCSFHCTIGRSPYNALFGNDPKVGLISLRLLNSFVKTIKTEEEIEEIEEILQCSTVNYTCDLCKIEMNEVENQDEAGPFMCNLCRKKEHIKMQRKKGYDGIKKFVEKMLQENF